jgi:hypothetical protein
LKSGCWEGELQVQGDGIDFVRGVCRMHVKPIFAARILALNIAVQPRVLEDFVDGKVELPPEAMAKLVDILFHSRARWNEEAQCLDDVVKPATAMPDTSKLPHGVVNTGL